MLLLIRRYRRRFTIHSSYACTHTHTDTHTHSKEQDSRGHEHSHAFTCADTHAHTQTHTGDTHMLGKRGATQFSIIVINWMLVWNDLQHPKPFSWRAGVPHSYTWVKSLKLFHTAKLQFLLCSTKHQTPVNSSDKHKA